MEKPLLWLSQEQQEHYEKSWLPNVRLLQHWHFFTVRKNDSIVLWHKHGPHPWGTEAQGEHIELVHFSQSSIILKCPILASVTQASSEKFGKYPEKCVKII